MFKKTLPTLFCLIFTQLVLWSEEVYANWVEDYVPRSNSQEVAQKRTLGKGSEYMCKSNLPPGSITLLVPPSEVVHLSTSANPSFFLHSQVASNLPFKFTLVNPDVDKPKSRKNFLDF